MKGHLKRNRLKTPIIINIKMISNKISGGDLPRTRDKDGALLLLRIRYILTGNHHGII